MKNLFPILPSCLLVILITTTTGCFELQKPQFVEGTTVKHLDQNWTPEQRDQFYHASQGTVLMKTKWFQALEQPEVKFVGEVHLFRENDYLARFGFIPDKKSDANPLGLPVGFAISDIVRPTDGAEQNVVGLTCAACHTGELHFNNKRVRIDGGPSLIDLATFQQAVGAAFMLTAKMPGRFDRFAKRVLGDDHDHESYENLRKEVDTILAKGLAEKDAADERALYDGHDGGFGRTDALAKIGNFVFGTELADDNLRVGSAPVRFPPLWDTVWFDWTQYNGSIAQPMVRNIGEALGVRALINLDPSSENFMDSTVDIPGLHKIENLLAGEERLQGLHSPQWPTSVFGELDPLKVNSGKELYEAHCQKCHLPPLESDEIWEEKYWVSNTDPHMTGGLNAPVTPKKFLNLYGINLGDIGTDKGQAANFFGRYVNTGSTVLPSITRGMWDPDKEKWIGPKWYTRDKGVEDIRRDGLDTILPVGAALQMITVGVAERYYDKQNMSEVERQKFSGDRAPAADSPLAYRPRPLNGIWASPPYLHNGSVRTLYQLLSPQSEREDVFYTGTREYDVKNVGYKSTKIHGAFRYDTSIEGNRNTGHIFDSLPSGQGVIGPLLSSEDRYNIIEYLKSLGPAKPPKN